MQNTLTDGIWSRPSDSFRGESDYLIINTKRRWIVIFNVAGLNPPRRLPYTLWYRNDTGSSIESIRPKSTEWRLDQYRLHDGRLWWIKSHGEYHWDPISFEDAPSWLTSYLEKTFLQMLNDSHTAEQGAAANP